MRGVEKARIEDYPYLVQLVQKKSDSEGLYRCAGVILDESIILTAAECVKLKNANFIIKVGTTDVNEGGLQNQIEGIVSHNLYDPVSLDYNVALVKLKDALKYSDTVQPIELADDGWECNRTNYGSYRGSVVGWTWWGDDKPSNGLLKRSELQVIPQKRCEDFWKIFRGTHRNNNKIFCAYKVDHCGICGGEFGGIFIMNKKVYGFTLGGPRKCAVKKYCELDKEK
ncbi:trypsin-1-like [Chrysoperla carnea]|uniref:trypsin-1-like n=1 Tax=Chrysoperla carnea TaxID=189513 RepID=UPI001D07A4B7|nr:trypsin-1-like [Chrysoperla carnea]